jgi:hypothetical protein
MFFEGDGSYGFQPYAFTIASGNQWNVMATGDLNHDGRLDVIVGAMDLGSVLGGQRGRSGHSSQTGRIPILFFENRMGLTVGVAAAKKH